MDATYGEFPYAYPIDAANRKCRERYPGFHILTRIPSVLFPQRDTYTLCHAYFRWYDDIVDSLHQHPSDVSHLVDRQRRYVDLLYTKKHPEELATEELFLAHLVKFDQSRGEHLRDDIMKLIRTMEFDAERKGCVLDSSELSSYVDDNVHAYVNIALGVLDVDVHRRDSLYAIAKAGFVTDFVYDARTDLRLGYVNVSQQEIDTYHIDVRAPDSDAMRSWARDTATTQLRTLAAPISLEGASLLPKAIAHAMRWRRRKKAQHILDTDGVLPPLKNI